MRASKENAVKAKAQLRVLGNFVLAHRTELVEAVRFVEDFVAAAQKKLPSEVAFIKDEQKRTA